MSYRQSSFFSPPSPSQGRTDAEAKSWPSVREFVLKRDHYQCKKCAAIERLHVHHLVPRDMGGKDIPSNLITLCEGCHAQRHLFLQVSLARRTIEKWVFRVANFLSGTREYPDSGEALHRALQLLGVCRFRQGQLPPVLAALNGQSILVVRPTGSGKSLCFQVPGLIASGTMVVFTPLKALMTDQVSALHEQQIPVTFINSDISPPEKQQRYEMLRNGAWKLLYITPERFDASLLKDPWEVNEITRVRPSYLVIDEAHVVDSWGQDFRPMYGKFREIRAQLGNPPVIALTATAGPAMQDRILESIGIPDAQRFVESVDRPNIGLIRHEARPEERRQIIERLIRMSSGKIMVFVPTRRIGNEVQAYLKGHGLNVPFYHSRVKSVERSDIINRLKGIESPPLKAVICTNAFGMGMDIPDIRTVIHWSQPESVEDYLQEFGRAGRDGEQALAVVFYGDSEDRNIREYLARENLKKLRIALAAKKDILAGKMQNIEILHDLLRSRGICLRSALIRYLEVERPRQFKDLLMDLLEYLFSDRTKTHRSQFCCDYCHPGVARSVLANGFSALAPMDNREVAQASPVRTQLKEIVKILSSARSAWSELDESRDRLVLIAVVAIATVMMLCVMCLCLALLLNGSD